MEFPGHISKPLHGHLLMSGPNTSRPNQRSPERMVLLDTTSHKIKTVDLRAHDPQFHGRPVTKGRSSRQYFRPRTGGAYLETVHNDLLVPRPGSDLTQEHLDS